MLGFVPGIHVLLYWLLQQGVDGRNKSGHDGNRWSELITVKKNIAGTSPTIKELIQQC